MTKIIPRPPLCNSLNANDLQSTWRSLRILINPIKKCDTVKALIIKLTYLLSVTPPYHSFLSNPSPGMKVGFYHVIKWHYRIDYSNKIMLYYSCHVKSETLVLRCDIHFFQQQNSQNTYLSYSSKLHIYRKQFFTDLNEILLAPSNYWLLRQS